MGETDLGQLKVKTLFENISIINDPRIERHKRHSLVDILVIAICAMLCAAETWEDIEEFGHAKREWLATFLELENGIPSHDTNRAGIYFIGLGRVKVIVFRLGQIGGQFKCGAISQP